MKSFSTFLAVLTIFMPHSGLAKPDVLPLGPFGGDVRSLSIHPDLPNRVFLGTADGQIYVSEDWGINWKKLRPGLQRRELVIDSLVFHPGDPDTLYAGGWELKSDRGALYRTNDGGHTWTALDLGSFQSSIRAVAIAPSNPDHIAVGINEGVLLSTDSGTTWNRITRGYRSLYNVHSLTFDPANADRLYVGTFRLAWKTEDLGKKWIPIHDGMFWDSDLFSIQIDPTDNNRVFAGACSGIYRTLNAGERWVKLKNGLPDEAKRTRVVRIDPNDPQVIYAGTTVGLYTSRDGGDSWQSLLANHVINTIVIDPLNSKRIMLGTDDSGILVSNDQGSHFQSSNEGFILRQVTSISESSHGIFTTVSMDGIHGGIFYSTDQGLSWQLFNDGLDLSKIRIRQILSGEEKVYLASNQGLFIGFPGEMDWTLVQSTKSLSINDLDHQDSGQNGLLLATDSGIYSLDPNSGRLRKLKIPIYDRAVFSVLTDKTHSYIGTEMGVFRSEDGGKSWEIKVDGLPYTSIRRLRKVRDRLFCGTAIGVFYSEDNAETWKKGDGIFPIEIVSIAGGPENGQVFAADRTVGYLFESLDNGTSWNPIDLGSEISRVSALHLTQSGKLLAGTISEGIILIIPNQAEPDFQPDNAGTF